MQIPISAPGFLPSRADVPRWRRAWVPRTVATALTVVGLVVTVGMATDASASAGALAVYPPPGEFVRLSTGQRLHMVCAGEGGPGLVLLAGFGGDVLDWTPVLPALAASQRVCAVDRMGQGWSDPSGVTPEPTMAMAVDQVHEAMLGAGMDQPIVVGHSLGGAFAQIYAARYPVTGLVLVDGLTAGVSDPVLERLGTYQTLAPVARIGLLRPLVGGMVDIAYTGALRSEMVALRSRSTALLGVAREGAVAKRTGRAELGMAEATLQMGPVPLLVIAAGASDVPGLPAGAFADAERTFAESVPGARFQLIPEARHYIMAARPELVADLIQAWSRAVVG